MSWVSVESYQVEAIDVSFLDPLFHYIRNLGGCAICGGS